MKGAYFQFHLSVLCLAAIVAHSGWACILLQQHNSKSLIDILNLAVIKIPGLLVNSVSFAFQR